MTKKKITAEQNYLTKENLLAWCGIIFPFWLLITPHHNLFLYTINLLLPLIALAKVIFGKKDIDALVNEDETSKKNAWKGMSIYFGPPALILLLRAWKDEEVTFVSPLSFVLVCLLLFFAFALVILWEKDLRGIFTLEKLKKHIWVWVYLLPYSCGLALGLNCYYGDLWRDEYKTEVISRRKDRAYMRGMDSYTTYFITVGSDEIESVEIEVGPTAYAYAQPGSEYNFVIHKGLLFLSWY